MYRESELIVLDEATNALDLKTEKIINSVGKFENITIIMVAHRLDTLKICDKIYKIENNKIVEPVYKNFLMNKVSKITIITINYDDLDDLKKTIESVDSQKSRPQKHIIVSKKLKLNQLTKFKKKYRKFILGKDNSLFNAMNIGKKYSLNSPVIFLNSGDIFYNSNSIDLIQKYYKALKNKVVVFKTVLLCD